MAWAGFLQNRNKSIWFCFYLSDGNLQPVRERLMKLMSSDEIRITDSSYMRELSRKIQRSYEVTKKSFFFFYTNFLIYDKNFRTNRRGSCRIWSRMSGSGRGCSKWRASSPIPTRTAAAMRAKSPTSPVDTSRVHIWPLYRCAKSPTDREKKYILGNFETFCVIFFQ